jgi:hypothetical protein
VGLFLFQTWLGSGPLPVALSPEDEGLEVESRSPLVLFATNRGLEVGCGEAEAEDVVPFSPAFIFTLDPGAFGMENLANETGLNEAGFFTEPARL